MTIISTVFVPEGIAMSADSRITGEQNYDDGSRDRFIVTDSAQKLVLIRNSTIGIAFCGDASVNGKTVADILRIFDIQHVEEKDTVTEVSLKLQKLLVEDYSKHDITFLVAGFDDDEAYIYSVHKDMLENTSDNHLDIKTFGATWRGQTTAISKLFKDTPFNFKLMPLKDAVDFSEFIVDSTIKYMRFADSIATCGGPIDTLVITKDFAKFMKHKIINP
ncbi:hypothetical protein CKQ70_11085 [Bacillus toyonensis]|nr:hypothetical protein [Bacillus thuringiensis]PAW40223.1 hypothetical protein CKQ70_11085 [Bacillus toyonensis]HDR4482462.1 hypothetical protein [Bacillus cereus]MED3358106.1 hypothetical protein [Bacillus thuringiensis]PAW47089.1 hypothetical protein CKQ69_09210 [Bacillus toyonensis]